MMSRSRSWISLLLMLTATLLHAETAQHDPHDPNIPYQISTDEQRAALLEDAHHAMKVMDAIHPPKDYVPTQGRSAFTALYGKVTSTEAFTQGDLSFPAATDAKIIKFSKTGDAYLSYKNSSGEEKKSWINRDNVGHFQPTSRAKETQSKLAAPAPIMLAAMPSSDPSSEVRKGKWFQVIEDSRDQAHKRLGDAKQRMANWAWGYAAESGAVSAIPAAGPIAAMANDFASLVGWWFHCKYNYDSATELNMMMDNLGHNVAVDTSLVAGDMLVARAIPWAVRKIIVNQQIGVLQKSADTAINALDAIRDALKDQIQNNIRNMTEDQIENIRDLVYHDIEELGEQARRGMWASIGDTAASMRRTTSSAASAARSPFQTTWRLCWDLASPYARRMAADRAQTELPAAVEALTDGVEVGTLAAKAKVTELLAEQKAALTVPQTGLAFFPGVGNAIDGAIAFGMMRWTTGTMNDEFYHDYTKMIDVVHDAVHDAIEATIVKNKDGVFLQTQQTENFAIKDGKVSLDEQQRTPMDRWYFEKDQIRSPSQGNNICHGDYVYLMSMADGVDKSKYMDVNKNGEIFMSTDKNSVHPFILTKQMCMLSPDDKPTFDKDIHDTDGIYLASMFGQHHKNNQSEFPYAELIGVDKNGNFITQADRDASTLLVVQTARPGDSYGQKAVWKHCTECDGSGKRGLFGPRGFGILESMGCSWECKTCHGKGGWFVYVDNTTPTIPMKEVTETITCPECNGGCWHWTCWPCWTNCSRCSGAGKVTVTRKVPKWVPDQ